MTLIVNGELLLILLLTPSPILASLSFTNPLASQLAPNSANQPFISSVYPLEDVVGVRVPLGWSFSIGLLPDTCGDGSQQGHVRYSATGLPPWIVFSSAALTFSGASPDYYNEVSVNLICMQDDEEASDTFMIRTQGQLQLNNTVLSPLTTSPKNNVSYDLLPTIQLLNLDKSHLNQSEMDDVGVETPTDFDWLSWNPTLKALQGMLPDSFIGISSETSSVPINFTLPSALPITASFAIIIEPYLLTSDHYPPVYVFRQLLLPLQASLTDPSATLSVAFDPVIASQWINFDSPTTTLAGSFPSDFDYKTVHVTLKATSPETFLTATASFDIIMEDRMEGRLLSKRIIAVIIVMCITGIVSTFCLVYFLFIRCSGPITESRGRKNNRSSKQGTPETQKACITMRPNVTRDTLVDSLDLHATPKAKLLRWWSFGRREAQQSGSRARSVSKDAAGAQSSPSTPNIRRSSTRSRTHSSPGAILWQGLNEHGGGNNAQTSFDTWGPPTPKPPKGLSPEELKEWIDRYVCEWAAADGSSSASRSRRKPNDRRSSAPLPMHTTSVEEPWPRLAEDQSEIGELAVVPSPPLELNATDSPKASPIITRLLDSCPYLSHKQPANANANTLQSDLTTQARPPPIHRSTSYPNTINTAMTGSSAGPSDVSSVASWDSEDSWEMERRRNYEEPRRRSDFLAQPPVNLSRPRRSLSRRGHSETMNSIRRPTSASSGDRVSVESENASTSDVVPSIVVTAFGESTSGGQFAASMIKAVGHTATESPSPSSLSTTGAGAGNSAGMVRPHESAKHTETFPATPSPSPDSYPLPSDRSLPAEARTPYDNFSGDEDEEIIFFPRPIGAELPGTGLARSPHLEGLSRRSLAALCLVSQCFQSIAQPHLYYDPFFGPWYPDQPKAKRLKQRQKLRLVLMADQRLADLVRVYRPIDWCDTDFTLDTSDDIKVLTQLRHLTSLYQHRSLGLSVHHCASNKLQTLEVDSRTIVSWNSLGSVEKFWEWLEKLCDLRRLSLQGVPLPSSEIVAARYPRLETLMADGRVAMAILLRNKVERFFTLENGCDTYLEDLIPLFDDTLHDVHISIYVRKVPILFDLLRQHVKNLRTIRVSLNQSDHSLKSAPEIKQEIYSALYGFSQLEELHVVFPVQETKGLGAETMDFMSTPVDDAGRATRCPNLAVIKWFVSYVGEYGEVVQHRFRLDVPKATWKRWQSKEPYVDWWIGNRLDDFEERGGENEYEGDDLAADGSRRGVWLVA
ncbi:hypothetical protein FRB96_000315 [Tulasnella sp. 330]|nr:hypothetical protein FRB96_000315 [Tulasnella sp. 330]